jgi:hypothetical protein
MSYVVMTLAALGVIGSGLFALLALFAQGMSDAPTETWALDEARTAGWVCAICVIIFIATWRYAHA